MSKWNGGRSDQGMRPGRRHKARIGRWIALAGLFATSITAIPCAWAGAGSARPIDRDALTPAERQKLNGIAAAAPNDLLDAGFDMFATASGSTGEKPQSKIWYHDGSYWGAFRGSDGVAIYEKQGSTWVHGTFANALLSTGGHADVKWTGTNLYVLVYNTTCNVFEFTYNSAARTWTRTSGFPVKVPNPAGSETMVLESDSTGRLWLVAEGGGNINAYYTTSADRKTWATTPVMLQTGVGADDICSIVAFGGNKVGVFWSDQNRDDFGFRIHTDGDSPATWATKELVDQGSGHADDHLNLAYDSSGRVFAITKDASDRMTVHRRNTNGSWSHVTDVVGGNATRGIIMVSESDSKLYILYTRWGVSPERIEYRVADINIMAFGGTVQFITSSANLNNVTGMKQILPPGSLCAAAENGSHLLYNSFGSPPPGSNPPPPPPTPPVAPANVLASLLNGTQIHITWTAAAGTIDGYNIYRQLDGGSLTKINAALVATLNFTDTAPPTGNLCYLVRSQRNGLESISSTASCLAYAPPPPPPPASPTNVLASLFNSTQIQVTWTAATGTIDGYNVYRQLDGGSFAKINAALITLLAFTDTAPATGNLCYQIRSQRNGLESASSGASCLSYAPPPPPPVPPTDVVASLFNSTEIEVTWTAATGTIDGYDIYRQLDGGSFTKINGALVTLLTFTDSAPPTGNLCYQVRSQRNSLESTPSAASCLAFAPPPPPPPPPPAAPTDVLASLLNGTQIQIGWTAAAGTIDGYNIYRQLDGGGFAKINAALIAALDFTDPAPPTGNVCYDVRSQQGTMESGPSTAFCLDFAPPPPPPPPAAPTDILASLLNGTQIHVTWTAAAGTIDGYNIYRQLDGGSFAKINGALIAALDFTDPAPPTGNVCYDVRSLQGPSESGPSTASCLDFAPPPPPPPPAAPTDILASLLNGTQIQVMWTAAAGTIDGYNIYRQLDGGSFDKINGSLIAALDFTDPAPPTGNVCYDVRAQQGVLESGPSTASCLAFAPPPPPPPPPAPTEPQTLTATLVTVPGSAVPGAGAWPFDEGSGQSFADATGAGHTGQLGTAAGVDTADPLWGAGVNGTSALVFDGSNDRSAIPDAADLHFAGSFSIEAWVKRDVIGAKHCIASKGDSQHRNFWVVIDGSNRIDFRWETAGGGNHGVTSNTIIADLNWHHVACVYDAVVHQNRIYCDGLLVKSATDNGTPMTSTDPVYIGARLSSGKLTDYFRGSIDQLRIAPGTLYLSNFIPATSFGGGPPVSAVQLAWQPPLSGSIAGYNVYRQVDGGMFAKLNGALIGAPSYVDGTLPAGTLCYQVTAVDAIPQEGPASTEACVNQNAAKAATKVTSTTAPHNDAQLSAGPNPFNPTTTVSFSLPHAGVIHLAIFDIRGERIVTLAEGLHAAGAHTVTWNGHDQHGRAVASGAYFLKLDGDKISQHRRIVLLK